MNTDTRHYLGWGARLRLLGRILGITALFAALGGFFLLWATAHEISLGNVQSSLTSGAGTAFIAAVLIVAGGGIALLIVVVELLGWIGGSGQRSATGANAAAQVLLALAAFAFLNVFAFDYFKRWDLTRDKEFTLPGPVASELRKLDGKTTIVVLQQHKTFGQLSPKPDIYDYAAERKVVDKVKDLVEEFRLLGPQFRVVTLDVEAIGYQDQLAAETDHRPGLKEAIAAAPENSIFFYPDDRVETLPADEARRREAAGRRVHLQPLPKDPNAVLAYDGNIPRLSFNEFYQLDKTASKEANPGPDGKPRGNLVLRPQGVEAFARRVLAIQEKRPKVGVLVIHEALSTNESEGWPEQYTSSGLRKALEDHGMDVVDVLLKKWTPREEPAPAAYNLEETRFDRLDAELRSIDSQLRGLRNEKEKASDFLKELRESTLDQLNQKYRARLRREITEELRQRNIRAITETLEQVDERTAELEKDRLDTDAKVKALMRNERAFEDRRVTDLRAKLERLVSECDLLIIPRHTLINISIRPPQFINPPIFRLSAPQIDVIKEFMKKGKPVLACIGPNNDPDSPPSFEALDDFERLIGERGVELGRQTILFDSEMKGFAAREAGDALGGSPTEIPPVTFPAGPADKAPNPIAMAMRSVAASADQQLELRLRHPRPIYVDPVVAKRNHFATDFLATVNASWNEEQPFPSERQISAREIAIIPPRYEATPFDDPKKGTHDEERRGPFPVGVAVEGPAPVEWFEADYGDYRKAATLTGRADGGLLAACLTARAAVDPDKETKALAPQTKRPSGRLVVIGQGGLFSGKQLGPAQEQLLLHTCNWLLKRDDRLPRTDAEWSYPRVQRDEREGFLWKYGPFLGLPAFFLYLGLIVWIVRRVR
jgi:hypothetical protein